MLPRMANSHERWPPTGPLRYWMNAATKFLNRRSALLLALGIVMCLQSFYTIEWSFPYCSSQADGPASAAFGMPLPYIQWSGVSSLEYDFLPLVYILNVLLLLMLAWPITSLLLRKLPEKRSSIRTGLGLVGIALAFLVTAGVVLLVSIGAWRPTSSLTRKGYYSYSDFRPIRFTVNNLHYYCTPSPAWFPNGWTQR
jgi:hypothetical protein